LRPSAGSTARSTMMTAWPGEPGWMKTSPMAASARLSTGRSSWASERVLAKP
jgi:hypothetical protein